MAKSVTQLSEENKKLTKENDMLRKQLVEARKSIDVIKTGDIDALVITDKNDLKVYTEKTGDEPYRILIENMHEGAVTLNQDGTVLYCNSYFSNMVNLPLEKVIGSKFNNLINDITKKDFKTTFENGRKNLVEEVYLYKQGAENIPVQMSINNLSSDNNFLLSVIVTDLTIQNRNKEELKNRAAQLELKNTELEIANKDLTTFTYVSSHDLQEPLRKIQNFVKLLLKEETENLSTEGKIYLQRTFETAKRMQALIGDLLSYSRTRNYNHTFVEIDLNNILDDIRNDLKEELFEKSATLEANLCKVNIIRFQFYQILYNLISNSLKFSRVNVAPNIVLVSKIVHGKDLTNQKPHIPASKLSLEIDYCHITYTDNGIGFDDEYSERIFEMFQRLHSQEEYKGTGIGLAICKRIVENHNGIITATGETNKGARFDIYIPAM